MTTIRGHIIALDPNNTQAAHLKKACDDCLDKGIPIDETKLHKPTQGKLRKQLNSIKRQQFPFMLEVTKCFPQLAIMQPGDNSNAFLRVKANTPNIERKALMTAFLFPTTNLN